MARRYGYKLRKVPVPFPVELREGEDALLTLPEAADLLAISASHLRSYLDEFFPERVQYGKRTVRIRMSDVVRLINERTRRTTPRPLDEVLADLDKNQLDQR
jgi:predicted DNA-binding transcriptional regulator AlpA